MTFPLFGNVHPFHSSVGECVYNPKEKVWEISIRLFQDDLEQGLVPTPNYLDTFVERVV
ncbi:DUF6702 family protein [Aquirufa regiilacus]|uniref:Uncharacterized protein n=1 Tax=Aquirufa regiilacus TaxID=3024868 RepID=A0ABU3TSN2_9BACT|nr:DUF6702 family protein [Aquirufa sp. LEOWEIH-7C]MDU0808883.1 hypothetical protein [Aquirufa sp. LEOWEIH-7C]